MRDKFTATLHTLAEKDKNIILITGDLGFGVLKKYWEDFPKQFINAGISEQAMTGMAAGMALEGKTVFTYSIGNFPTLRCIEQIRNDCAYHNANVKIVCVGGGFVYGALGMSHHATEDIAMLRALPNVVVMAPGDPIEAEAAVKAIYEYAGLCYLRLGRGGEKYIHTEEVKHYKIGQSLKFYSGNDLYLFSTGGILGEAKRAADILRVRGISAGLISFPTVKPIDMRTIQDTAKTVKHIFTIEEHNIVGGFGSAVAEVVAGISDKCSNVVRIGLNDQYSSIVGTQDYLRHMYGMSAEKIVLKVLKTIGRGYYEYSSNFG